MVNKKIVPKYSVDSLASALWLNLARDSRETLGQDFLRGAQEALLSGIPLFRQYTFPILPDGVSPYIFKWQVQMESLLKKYRFTSDLYTDAELKMRTNSDFFAFQERINAPKKPRSEILHRVFQEARKLVKGILGSLDREAVMNGVRFGEKSSIGCPFDLAYIDHKLTDIKAFTGSSHGTEWFFDEYLDTDPILKGIVKRLLRCNNDADLHHNTLNLINVPKAWNKLRPITPLTLLTLFYTFGVGELVSDRLKCNGLDIRRLQQRHRKIIRKYSLTCSHVTLDITRASDSILSEHLNALLPREWYQAIMKSTTRQIYVDGILCYTGSVLPMGNGLTFPVETLIFYCLIKAIGNLANCQGTYSAYGDDLIFPSKIYPMVLRVFKELGYMPNLEKTFNQSPFRESCGEDFFRGCPVRPFIFGAETGELTRSKYLSLLYKTYNGLTRRWHSCEVSGTLTFLLAEIQKLNLPVNRVPPSFPDSSGIKVLDPWEIPMGCAGVAMYPILRTFEDGSRCFTFSFLSETSDRRFVVDQTPYYWRHLSGYIPEKDESSGVVYTQSKDCGSTLMFVRTKKLREYTDKTGRICKRVITGWKPAVAAIGSSRITVRTGSASDWF